jgi:hypothetical protein
MIKFEFNMLVLNSSFSEEDVEQINAYADYVRKQERERILEYLEKVRQETLEDHEELDEYDKGFTDAYANAIDLIKWRNP